VTRLRSSSASRHARPEPGIRRRLASRPLLPTTAFARCRSTLRTSSDAVSGEAGASKRPFPPPQRLFLYGTPAPGSACLACLFSTAPYRPRARSVACSPPRDPFSGSQGGSTPATRCPHHLSGAPTALRALLPLGTFDPSGSPLDPIHRSGNLPPRDTRSPFTPRLRKLCDHRRRINVPGSLRPAGLAVPRTSWNHLYLARKPARSQIENMRCIGFFRRKSGMCFQ